MCKEEKGNNVCVEDKKIRYCNTFKCLDSIITNNEKVEKDLNSMKSHFKIKQQFAFMLSTK